MVRYSMQLEVNVPVEKVFQYLADLTHIVEWVSDIESMEKTSEGPVGIGSTFAVVTGDYTGPPEIKFRGNFVITEYIANEAIGYESEFLGLRARTLLQMRPSGGGTLITVDEEGRPRNLISYLIMLLSRPFAKWNSNRTLRRLKTRLEALQQTALDTRSLNI